ncbi:hypothetical protein [Hafnia paralvei]|uniref:hypothetical protein n=1 Tax=Hafnia paralvei TaxID=546367 RepID=UPI003C2AD4AE
MAKLTTERLEKRIKNCIEVGNGCVMLPVSVAEELLAYRKTVNHLLDNDGSRGKFSAVQSYDAREDLERLLAPTAQQNEPQNIPTQPVSNPYKLPVRYFSYGSECGFDWHNTEKEAIEAAEAVIDDYRGDACDGWSEETDSVCWGVILQQATKVDERPRTDDDKCDPAIDTVCDYALLPELVGNSPVIPDGWKLVPIEPTAAMFHAFNDCDYGRKSMRERYIQMIEAAPARESE